MQPSLESRDAPSRSTSEAGDALQQLSPVPVDGGRAYVIAFEILCEEGVGRALSLSSTLTRARAILFNPDAVVGPAHVITAVDYALASIRLGRNIARSLHVEAFLFAAATREISKALELFQPDVNGQRAVVALVAESAEACIREARSFCERAGARARPIGYNDSAAKLIAERLGIKEIEMRATYSDSFAVAVEKCVLSRMALEFLSR